MLTPHLGYVTEDTYEVFYREAVEDVAAWLAGDPIRELTVNLSGRERARTVLD